MWPVFIWLRIGSRGRLLLSQQWTYGFHKSWGISESLFASQKQLGPTEWVRKVYIRKLNCVFGKKAAYEPVTWLQPHCTNSDSTYLRLRVPYCKLKSIYDTADCDNLRDHNPNVPVNRFFYGRSHFFKIQYFFDWTRHSKFLWNLKFITF
jgi:hypothetical protein